MPTITCGLEKDERMGRSTYKFRVDGKSILGLTSESGESAATRLKAICERNADKLLELVSASDKARQDNMDALAAGGKGKDWPAFRALDKFKDALLKEANIKDS